ncbi:MAG: hypothetical protein J2P46_03065, partial [Zavarzinella sp.]|nr:hypothetical protein [Zavarzinella sp.]
LDVQERLHNADPDYPGYRQDLSRTHYNLGIVARETGDPADAVSELTAAARLLDGLPADDMIQRRHRARIDLNLGPALRADHRLGEAAAACDRAIALFDALIAEHPDRYAFRYEREMAVINRGLVRLSDRDPAKAEADLTSARDALARLVNDFKHTPLYRAGLAKAYNGLAAVAFDTGRADEAADMSAKAADEWTALIAQQGTADYHGELGISLCNRGRALYGSNAMAAKDLLTHGLTELLIGLRANPQEPAFNDTFQKQSRVLAGLLVWDQDRMGAEKLANRIVAELPDPVRSTHRAVVLLAACVAAVGHQKRATTEADAYEAVAIKLVTAVRPADWSALRADPDCAPLMARPGFAAAVAP